MLRLVPLMPQIFGYSYSTAETIINNLNAQTTQLYLFPQLTLLDLFYPFLLALFLGSVLFRNVNIGSTLGFLIVGIPFLAMIFDYSENICVILMISKSIKISESIVLLSSSFTVLKGILTSIAWLAILIYFIKWLVSIFKEKYNKQTLTKPKMH